MGTYYLYYNGNIYTQSVATSMLEKAVSFETASFSSRADALYVVSECQDMLMRNSLKYERNFIYEQCEILDHVEVLSSSDIRLANLLND